MEHGRRVAFLCFFGLLFAIMGMVVVLVLPAVLTVFIHEKMALTEDNPGFPLWRDMNIPIYQNFYFYNVTNPREIESNGAKPILKEIGPFVYRVNISKSDLIFKQNDTRLTFRETKSFHFDRSKSAHDLNITLTTLNAPLVVMYSFISKMTNKAYRDVAMFFLKKLKPSFFFEATVDELTFKGKSNAISCLSHLLSPDLQPDCLFSFFRGQNNSNDGLFEIFTGKDHIEKVNKLYQLNGTNRLDFWDGDDCNRIAGSSNGELFPPLDVVPGGNNRTFQFFRTDFCRVFNITLNETNVESEVGDLVVDRFRPVANLFSNATENPKNACYRPKRTSPSPSPNTKFSFRQLIDLLKREGFGFKTIEELLLFDHSQLSKSSSNDDDDGVKSNQSNKFVERPSGVFDLSACHQGAPVLISYPHFLGADPFYLRTVDGIHPNQSLHETFLNIEPKTGTPVDFIARIQLNLDVDTSNSGYPAMRSMVFPVLWQEFSIHITDKLASTLKFETSTLHIAILSVALLVLVIGSVVALYGGALICMHLHQKQMAKKSLDNSDPGSSSNDIDPLLDNIQQDTNNNSLVH